MLVMLVFKLIVYVLSIVLILIVLLPLCKKDYWVFRVFDYPRVQKFTGIVILCFPWIFLLYSDAQWYDYLLFAILLTCLVHIMFLIYPFTPFGKKMVGKANPTANLPTLNLLVANVFQDNRNYNQLLQLVECRNPDIVFLLETDDVWQEGVKKLRNSFPYSIEVPQKNTYGLLFYSKLPLKTQQINYLIDHEIPSVIAEIEFDTHTVKIFGLHPTPPTPQENEQSTERDAEILMIGKMADKEKGPCLVIGDLNDVAWSSTTELFLKISGLLDPRRGRGLFSTFHAKYFFLRWPLDHFFISGHFRLVKMKVEKNIGSDHFPISISLVISSKNDNNQLHADEEDKKLVDKKIKAAIQGNHR